MRILLFLLIFTLILNAKNEESYPDKIKFKVGVFFVGNQDSDLKVTKGGVGAIFNVQDLFNLETTQFAVRIESSYRFNECHGVEFLWYRILNSGYTDKDIRFTWGDKDIIANGELKSHFNTDIYKMNYLYSFYHSSEVEMKLSAGIHVTTIDLGFEGNYATDDNPDTIQKSNKKLSTLAPLPVIGYRLEYSITQEWVVSFSIDYLYLAFSGFSGGMTDILLSMEYNFFKNFGVGLGFNSTQMHFKMEEDDTEYKLVHSVTGGLLYIISNF